MLLVFGTLNDRHEIGHYAKFVGQLLAVLPVVLYGGVYITHLSLFGPEPIPAGVGVPFTIFAMMGMINAINHSDGLDGLAGGEACCGAWRRSFSSVTWLAAIRFSP